MSSPRNSEFLFVYGTLLSNYLQNPFKDHFSNHLILISQARVKGQLFLVTNYPAWIPETEENEWVYGEVFRMKNVESTLKLLDQYESFEIDNPSSSEYLRVIEKVELIKDDFSVYSWIYKFNMPTNNLRKIQNGNFLNFNINNHL